MAVIHAIAQTIWFDTPLGQGRALWLIDRGPDSNLEFVIALKDGKIVSFSNEHILLAKNYTLECRGVWADFKARFMS